MPENATLTFLDAVRDRVLSLAADLRYDGTHIWHIQLLALYGTILELAHSVVVLAKYDSPVGVPIVLRSMLEAAVDLKNLVRDPTYGYWLEANALDQKIRFMENVEKDTSAWASTIREMPEFSTKLNEYRQHTGRIAEAAGDWRQRTISKRFERADMRRDYQTVYASLCSAAHNDSTALNERHVATGDEESPVYFHREVALEEIEHFFGIALSIVINSTVDVHDTVESTVRNEVQELKLEHDRFIAAAEARIR